MKNEVNHISQYHPAYMSHHQKKNEASEFRRDIVASIKMLDLGSIANVRQALRMYERCIELSPTSKNPSQNRLLALNYLSGHSVMNGHPVCAKSCNKQNLEALHHIFDLE